MALKTTVLFGNGVNLLKSNNSWDKILSEISDSALPQIGNNTMKYEYIILPKEQYTPCELKTRNGMVLRCRDGKRLLTKEVTENVVKSELYDKLIDGDSWFYDELVNLNADNYLTTNYEDYLNKKYAEREPKEGNLPYSEERRLKAHDVVRHNGKDVTIWNIHGSLDKPKSILLGMYEYSNYLAEIHKHLENDSNFERNCWVNLFFKTNVHIIGFGFGYEEVDLWYILISRKRMMREGMSINNKIYFYYIKDGSYDVGKQKLLEAAGVKVVEIEHDGSTDTYPKAYRQIIKEYNKLSEYEFQ